MKIIEKKNMLETMYHRQEEEGHTPQDVLLSKFSERRLKRRYDVSGGLV